jgi:hypothetical protein
MKITLSTCQCGQVHVQARPGEKCGSCRFQEKTRKMAIKKSLDLMSKKK